MNSVTQKSGTIIASRREELALPQSELASMLGCSNANLLSMIESGQSAVPFDLVPKLAEALNIDGRVFAEQVLRERHPDFADVLLGPPDK